MTSVDVWTSVLMHTLSNQCVKIVNEEYLTSLNLGIQECHAITP